MVFLHTLIRLKGVPGYPSPQPLQEGACSRPADPRPRPATRESAVLVFYLDGWCVSPADPGRVGLRPYLSNETTEEAINPGK